MKKLSLTLAALALVLGMSQCKKQEEPVQNGEKQHIVLTANNGNDGSKVSGSFESAALNLTWEGNESITVSGGASGMLTYKSGVGTPNATFEGDITIDRGGDIVFTIGDAPSSYANQTGTADGCAAWIKGNNHFVGTSQWQDDGNYNVTMELQYAVLKLDVSALGTTGAMTIAANGATVASVANVSGIANAVFVAVPTDETEKAYTITCGGKIATKTWTLEKNVFYTKAGAEGAGTGEAIVIKHEFTVGMDGDTPIKVGTGFMVFAEGENPTLTYERGSGDSKDDVLALNLFAGNGNGEDNPIIVLDDEEGGFVKADNLSNDVPQIYTEKLGDKYGICNFPTDTKEVPVSFKAVGEGSNTVRLETIGEFDYVHLYDRFTDVDVDMLLEGSYTFEASENDDTHRFIVIIDKGDLGIEDVNGNESFVSVRNGEIHVSGSGEVQIIDVMGRMMHSEVISGDATISTSGFKSGVYVVRLIGDGWTKAEKIVVRR